jgi:hypothetical protein
MSGSPTPGRPRGGGRRGRRSQVRSATAPSPPASLALRKDLRSRARDADRFIVPMERRRRSRRMDPIELDVRHWWRWFTQRPGG